MFKDYYAILRIPFSASAEQIRASFKKLALLHHPDRTIHLSTTNNNFSKSEPLEKNKLIEDNSRTLDNHLTHSASAKNTNEKINYKSEQSWEQEEKEEEQEEEVHTIFANNMSENVQYEHKSRETEAIEQYGDTNTGVEFTDVTEAYEVLSDVARRYLYDLNYVKLREICQRERERDNLQAQLALAAKKMKARQRYRQYCEQEQNKLRQQQQYQQQSKQMENMQELEQAESGQSKLFNKEPCQNKSKCNPTLSPILQTTSSIASTKNSKNQNGQDGRMDDVDSICNGSKVPVTMELKNNAYPTITSKSNTISNNSSDEDVEGKTSAKNKEGKYSRIEEKKARYKNLTKYNSYSENEGETKINNNNVTEYNRHEARINNLSSSLPVLVASKKIMSLPITSKSLNLKYDVRADSIYAATNSDRHIDVNAATSTTNTNRLSLPALKHAKISSYTHHNINVQQRHQRAIRNTVRIFFARELGLNT